MGTDRGQFHEPRSVMSQHADHDQDSEPPTPDGKQPDASPSKLDDEPGSDPDPAPGGDDESS